MLQFVEVALTYNARWQVSGIQGLEIRHAGGGTDGGAAMAAVMQALARAFASLAAPRMLALMLLPVLGSLLLWTVIAWLFWDAWTGLVTGFLRMTVVAGWLRDWNALWIIDYTAMLAVVLAIVPAMLVTSLLITEIFAMPVIIGFVAARHYPQLARTAGGLPLAGALFNAATAVALFALLWVLTLPLWLTGVGAVLAPVLTSGWLNQRLFRYDALSEHAGRAEYERVVAAWRGEFFLLGVMLAFMLYVPLLNLAVPLLSGLAFTHFALGRLEALRRTERSLA